MPALELTQPGRVDFSTRDKYAVPICRSVSAWTARVSGPHTYIYMLQWATLTVGENMFALYIYMGALHVQNRLEYPAARTDAIVQTCSHPL